MSFFMDGFEQFDKSDRLAVDMRRADYTVGSNVSMAAGRANGSRAIACSRASVERSFAWLEPIIAVGVAVKFNGRGGTLKIGPVELIIDSEDGAPSFLGIRGGLRPIVDRWYFIEFVLDKNEATVSLFINGKPDGVAPMPVALLSSTSITVTLNPFSLPTSLIAEKPATDYATRTYDDLYVADGVRVQPIQITTRFPTEDRETDWLTEATGNHSTILGKLPVEVLDRYIFSNEEGARDGFKSSTVFPDGAKPVALGAVGLFRKTDNVYAAIEFDVAGRTTRVDNIGSDWKYAYAYVDVADTDTTDSIVAAEFGITVRKTSA